MIKIKSITDVITNSSTEVFIFKKNSDFYKELKEFMGPVADRFLEFDTIEDVWNYLNSDDYYGENLFSTSGAQCVIGNYDEWEGLGPQPFNYSGELGPTMEKMIEDGVKTKREIFDFFEPVYRKALEVAYYSFETDCCFDREFCNRYEEFCKKKKEEAYKKLIDAHRKIGYVQFKPAYDTWTKPIIAKIEGDHLVDFWQEECVEPKYDGDYEFRLGVDGGEFRDGLVSVILETAEDATQEQIKNYEKALKRYEQKRSKKTIKEG